MCLGLRQTEPMNRLEFFASLVGSFVALAWPAAAVVLVLVFRSQIREALKSLMAKESGQIELPLVKAQWEMKAAQLEAEIAGIQEIDGESDTAADSPVEIREIRDPDFVNMAMQFLTIHKALKGELEARNVDVSAYQTLEALSAVAAVEGIIEPDEHKMLAELSQIMQQLVSVAVDDREIVSARMIRMTARMARHIVEQTERAQRERLNLGQ